MKDFQVSLKIRQSSEADFFGVIEEHFDAG
jgi:hypothetical protein